MARDVRGGTPNATSRDAYTRPKEGSRMGGGRYDAGPGNAGLPGAEVMDRPATPCGTFGRTGSRRMGIDPGIRSIQDANKG
jgi:hypothetical protein